MKEGAAEAGRASNASLRDWDFVLGLLGSHRELGAGQRQLWVMWRMDWRSRGG